MMMSAAVYARARIKAQIMIFTRLLDTVNRRDAQGLLALKPTG
jgi:hypothetical protein